jgi:uncharacterized protein YjhX (UPF0386 family)
MIEEKIEKELLIYGVKIGGIELTLDNKFTNTFEDIARELHSHLIDSESEKILLMQKDNEKDIIEKECNQEEGFHATAMILKYFKDRVKALKEYTRLQEYRVNKIICLVKKVEKRRNKKKLNKKFKK